jgi:hypothetical protein
VLPSRRAIETRQDASIFWTCSLGLCFGVRAAGEEGGGSGGAAAARVPWRARRRRRRTASRVEGPHSSSLLLLAASFHFSLCLELGFVVAILEVYEPISIGIE